MAFSESTRPSGSGDSARRWLALGVVVAVAFVGAAVWRARSVVVPSRSPDAGSLQVEKITNRGNVTDIALSNDGRYLAYVTADDARAIWLRDLIEKTENRLVALSRTARLGEFRFAKDGQSIYFDSPTNGPDDAIYRVPLIGGTPRLVRRGALLDALSPDDKHIIERRKREGAWRLFITNIETDLEKDVGAGTWLSGEWSWSPDVSRLLGAREEGDRFALFQFMADGAAEKRIGDFATPPLDAVWRPGGDGALLVLGVDEEHFRLNYVDLTTGLTKPIGSRVWPRRILARWLTDGTGLIVNEETPYLRRALWLVSYPDGAALRIPADNLDYEHVALSGDGTKLAAVQSVARSTILVSSDPDRGVFNKIASGTGVLYRPCWTADGKVIFSSNDTGAYHLYVAEADGTNPTQLTFDRIGNETEPVASPDGRYIVFVSDRSGERGLYRINRDGTNLIRLTPEPKPHHYDRGPQITPDSQWVLYRHWDSGPRLWKISIDGGAPVFIRGSAQAPQESVYGGAASPDGRYLAYFYSAHDPKSPASSRMEIVISSADRFVKRFPFDVSIHVDDNLRLQWSPDGRNLYYNGGSGGAKLWKQALAGGPPVQITHFEEPLNYFDWSPDGKKLLVSRSSTLSDAVLITHFH